MAASTLRRSQSQRAARMAMAGVLLIGLLFSRGPRPRVSDSWQPPVLPEDVVDRVVRSETRVTALRPGDHKEVVWAPASGGEPTPLSLVYLHGFSADRHEIEPLVTHLARELGANTYFTRLRGHGRDGTAMGEARAEDWLEDVFEAIAIGRHIGDQVVVVGTSTGASLALWAANRPELEPHLAALLLVSPNFRLKARSSRLLLWPWGGLIARSVIGPERCFDAVNAEQERHWTTCYPTSALLPMAALVEHVRTSDLGAIETPVFLAYSPDDQVVDAAETGRLFAALGSAEKTLHEVVGPGDPANHVLAGDILSPETTDSLVGEMLRFLASLGLSH